MSSAISSPGLLPGNHKGPQEIMAQDTQEGKTRPGECSMFSSLNKTIMIKFCQDEMTSNENQFPSIYQLEPQLIMIQLVWIYDFLIVLKQHLKGAICMPGQ